MIITITCVLHGEKVKVLGENQALLANPTMSLKGMEATQALIERIRAVGPFDKVYASRLARANDTASVVCMGLNLDWETLKILGQYADRQDGKTVCYPGHEDEGYPKWQDHTKRLLTWIHDYYIRYLPLTTDGPDVIIDKPLAQHVLVFTHRVIIANLIGITQKISDLDRIKDIARGDKITQEQIYQFQYNMSDGSLINMSGKEY
ncbi:MAG: histidine phosphatase family protein [Patescibacteria group bacterium]